MPAPDVKADRPFFSMPYPDIFRVTCPLPFPGLDHVHVYIAQGANGGLTLIDTTLGWEDSFDRLEQGVRWLDRELTDIETIVITHAHPDHIGLAARLQKASGAEVLCHPIADEMMRDMHTPDRWQRVGAHYAQHGWEPNEASMRGFSLDLPERITLIGEGETLVFAGGAWDVHWTPGHEWGHIAFFRPGDALLLPGDTLLGSITPHIGYMLEPPDPLGQFLDSLDQLAALEPAFVLPGHGRPFDDGAERARSIRVHHEQRLRSVLEILLKARAPMPALEISGRLFGRKLMNFQERLALAETLSHLENLRLSGRVERDLADGIFHYGLPEFVG